MLVLALLLTISRQKTRRAGYFADGAWVGGGQGFQAGVVADGEFGVCVVGEELKGVEKNGGGGLG